MQVSRRTTLRSLRCARCAGGMHQQVGRAALRIQWYHPPGLPTSTLDIADIARATVPLPKAQGALSQPARHARWLAVLRERQASGRADAAAFISASQPYAGIFLDAMPRAYDMRIPSDVFQLIVQRRLRMPLSVLANVTYSRTLGSTWRQAAERLQPHHPPRGAAQAMGRCHPRCPRSLGCRARADEIQRVLPRRAAQECHPSRRACHL